MRADDSTETSSSDSSRSSKHGRSRSRTRRSHHHHPHHRRSRKPRSRHYDSGSSSSTSSDEVSSLGRRQQSRKSVRADSVSRRTTMLVPTPDYRRLPGCCCWSSFSPLQLSLSYCRAGGPRRMLVSHKRLSHPHRFLRPIRPVSHHPVVRITRY